MEASPTDLYLPQSFPYPIKIVSIDANPSSMVQRGTRLLSYSFAHLSHSHNAQPETRFGTWDSAIEGTVSSWKIKVGDVVSQRRAKEKPVGVVIEPCKHGMQVGGLCVLCGKDMTNIDYTGFSDASRASIQMTHSAFGPTVSLEEAQRIERETAQHLLESRKLSLIVDLDQTIVHATVDPTVGEWIAEGEAWEAKQAKKASTTPRTPDDSEASLSDSDDECNPNWEALKDVKKFRLGPESFGPPSMRSAQKGKGKNKVVENEGCMYYIKPRPGWKDFLRETAKKYEMHVYTMGTRAYAEEVCSAIDPDGCIFGGRILSRDESGSLTQKSLQRLFPCDTSMVVIIDDRADVWEWSPNLVKVIPYDFFVGIGDINSTFLPKVEPLTLTVPPQPPGERDTPQANNEITDPFPSEKPPAKFDPGTNSDSTEAERAARVTKALLTENNAALEAQLENRPLAKKQEALQEEVNHEQANHQTPEPTASVASTEETESSTSKHEKPVRKALLKNDDYELDRVGKLLNTVHNRFFSAHDLRSPETNKKRRHSSLNKSHDVTRIIPKMRSEVFEGVHILFSSVIPLDTRPETTEIWRMAHMFGAQCSTELTPDITHVVAAKRGTVKVDMARKRGGIRIVWLAWFTDCIALWQRLDETLYLLDEPASVGTVQGSSPITDVQQISSSDADIDTDEWDEEVIERTDSGDGTGNNDSAGEPPGTTAPGGVSGNGNGTVVGSTTLELTAIDWNDINDEVEAAMNESDDDDDDIRSEKSYQSGFRSGNVSEEDMTDEMASNASVPNTPRLKRKRLRSVTPSTQSENGDDAFLRSPLAKRKKLAAERTGFSRLKEGITAEELLISPEDPEATVQAERPIVMGSPGSIKEEEEEDGEDGEDDDEDDFLARELEEEWG